MGRVIKIIIYALLIIGAYFMVSFLFRACSDKSTEMLDDGTEIIDDAVESLEETGDELVEVFEDDEPMDDIDEAAAEDAEELFEETDYEEEETVENTYEAPATTNTSNNNNRSYSSSASGKYMVVAGNYLVKENASNMVKKLNRMGYSDAEYVVFDASSFYTVVASKSNSRSSAQSTTNNLKSNGVDCYVHTKQY